MLIVQRCKNGAYINMPTAIIMKFRMMAAMEPLVPIHVLIIGGTLQFTATEIAGTKCHAVAV
ncbi:hypothetical protein D3C81_2190240 [compost metagenome]